MSNLQNITKKTGESSRTCRRKHKSCKLFQLLPWSFENWIVTTWELLSALDELDVGRSQATFKRNCRMDSIGAGSAGCTAMLCTAQGEASTVNTCQQILASFACPSIGMTNDDLTGSLEM